MAQPTVVLYLNGKPLPELLQRRIVRFEYTDIIDLTGDSARVVIDDSPNADGSILERPPVNSRLQVKGGWTGEDLLDFGDWYLTEVQRSRPPRLITLSCGSALRADFNAVKKQTVDAPWRDKDGNVLLQDALRIVAKRMGLKRLDYKVKNVSARPDLLLGAEIPYQYKKRVKWIEWRSRSALAVLRDYKDKYHLTARIVDDVLIVADATKPRPLSYRGKIYESEVASWTVTQVSRAAVTEGEASFIDDNGLMINLFVDVYQGIQEGLPGRKWHVTEISPNKEMAYELAYSSYTNVQRGAWTARLRLDLGRGDLVAGQEVGLFGFGAEEDTIIWRVDEVKQVIEPQAGWTTELSLSVMPGAIPLLRADGVLESKPDVPPEEREPSLVFSEPSEPIADPSQPVEPTQPREDSEPPPDPEGFCKIGNPKICECRLSAHFTVGEFTGNDFSGCIPDRQFTSEAQLATARKLASFLERVRQKFGPLGISSGHRPTEVNRREGGAENSEHIYSGGTGAVDIYPLQGGEAALHEMERWIDDTWPDSVGKGAHRGFVHVGTGRGYRRWGYR